MIILFKIKFIPPEIRRKQREISMFLSFIRHKVIFKRDPTQNKINKKISFSFGGYNILRNLNVILIIMVYVAALMTETRHLESNLAPTNNKAHTGTDK